VLRNNMLSIYIAPNVYDAEGAVAREAARFVAWVKASPPLRPDAPVLLPGEVERATRSERTAQGIPIDDKTRVDLLAAAASVGIVSDRAEAMIA
jgi:hydroxycarboxylate dehydrogenase B